ncbi:aminodeoxychorismate/anthranilate synthase component II [Candidatus Micrarchaeota archaeon]|nr:aminodeoxychorismate/anthranilate synthase component II [Candidatus Micrarchaeota archaeon]
MILIIDNYDSFTYNLYQSIGGITTEEIAVYRNDEITIEGIKELSPKKIVFSPGPGNPSNKKDFGVCAEILSNLKVPILGVCLGHQGIIHHFGGKIVKNKPMHGKTSEIKHNETGIFQDVQSPLRVMRYHSLVGSEIPDCLVITARSDDCIMAVQHKELPVYGVQFHPESIMTENGEKILENFLRD